jgi:hypothetical protein
MGMLPSLLGIVLGQVVLALGDFVGAEEHFIHVCQANPRAAIAWFLRGYIAWKRQNSRRSSEMLSTARSARERDWKPVGSALEGDVQHRMYNESAFLNVFEEQWDGSAESAHSFDQLDQYLRRFN